MSCKLYIEPEAPTLNESSLPVPPVARVAWPHPSLARRVLLAAASGMHAMFGMRHRQAFGILMYHRITDPTVGLPAPTWNVPPQRFEEQLAGLLARGFEPWPLRKALDYSTRGIAIPRRAFVVTFDDGYENNFTNAFPILKRLRVPATIFLATAYLDSELPFPSDDWLAAGSSDVPAESWRPLTTQQCREMQQGGLIELAAHTHTHADFRGRPAALHEDLLHCLAELHERFGLKDAAFAFPYGTKRTGFSGGVLAEAARESGVLCSLTTESEVVLPGSDPFDWGRFTANECDSAAALAAKLSGWHSALRHAATAVRRSRR